jgi:hypothetical protein
MNQTFRRGARGLFALAIVLLPIAGTSNQNGAIDLPGERLSSTTADQQEKVDSTGLMANKNAIIDQLNTLSAQVYLYRVRPKEMGGGEGSYEGFSIPSKLASSEDASFTAAVLDSNHVRITALSAKGFGTVDVTVNEFGVLVDWAYAGKFNVPEKAGAATVQENRDAIINDLNNLAAFAYQFRIRPKSMGGGEGSYMGFDLPQSLRANENATYSIGGVAADTVKFMAISTYGYGVVTAQIDQDGRLGSWYYTDKFK